MLNNFYCGNRRLLIFIAVFCAITTKTTSNAATYKPTRKTTSSTTTTTPTMTTNSLPTSTAANCRTPDNATGRCMNVADCPHLLEMVRNSAANMENREFLKKSQCGLNAQETENSRKVLVCCPDFIIETKSSADETTTFTNANAPKKKILPGNVLPGTNVCGPILSSRIYGGNVTDIDEFPWMVLIEYKKPNNKYGFHCGGSLITSRYVLTAGHCVKNSNLPKSWEVHSVRLGEWDLDSDPDCYTHPLGYIDCNLPHLDVGVDSSLIHQQYNPESTKKFHDIALLRLMRAVAFNDFVRPVCLPIQQNLRSQNFAENNMDVAGWGITEDMEPSKLKLKISVRVWDTTECKQIFSSYQKEIDGRYQICAGGVEGVDTCRGDSGGGLTAELPIEKPIAVYITGIVSYGARPCGLRDWPGVYTRVSNYVDWIQTNLKP